jgi:hypothetical protein
MRVDLAMRVLSLLATAVLSPVGVDHGLTVRPRVDQVVPPCAKPGVVVTALGANLDRSRVMDVILTNSDRTALASVVAQSEDSIRFRIPHALAPGQYKIALVLASWWGSELAEQSVLFVVLEE